MSRFAPILFALALAGTAHAALSPAEKKISAAVDAAQDRDIGLLQKLVDQNSGTRNFDGVRAVAAMMQAELEPLGFTVKWVPMPETGRAGHLIATHKGRGKHILLIGHMDTVFDPGTAAARPFHIQEGIAHGPGVTDMKSGLLAGLYAVKAILAEAGMSFADVIRIAGFVTKREDFPAYMAVRDRYTLDPKPVSTLIVVGGFTRPEFLVEVEVTAAKVM